MPDRVVLFIDYQNVYMGARSCFHSLGEPHMCGQVDPLKLGLLLAADSPYDRELHQVRVYRGRPDSTRDPKGYAACTRQCDIWQQDSRVKVHLRTLNYPRNWPQEKPREKGIDVALAIDFATMALGGAYDVGILMSTDTDMKPALEAVARDSRARAEVAAWSGKDMHNRRLSIPGSQLWCHWLDETSYQKVTDVTDYAESP